MLGILCGLRSEKNIASKIHGAIVACAAARPHKARELARELVDSGVTRLMSFGIAGSLEPSANLGDIFVGSRVVSAKGQWACDEAWGLELAAKIPQVRRGGGYGSEVLVPTSEEKKALYGSTGCAIVDMESQCVAEIAEEAKLPFTVVRAVCDTSAMNIPPCVKAAIAEDGSIKGVKVLACLALHPAQIADLCGMMSGTNKALRALRNIRDVLGS